MEAAARAAAPRRGRFGAERSSWNGQESAAVEATLACGAFRRQLLARCEGERMPLRQAMALARHLDTCEECDRVKDDVDLLRRCRRVRPWLEPYWDGTLDGAAADVVVRHLHVCGACRAVFAALGPAAPEASAPSPPAVPATVRSGSATAPGARRHATPPTAAVPARAAAPRRRRRRVGTYLTFTGLASATATAGVLWVTTGNPLRSSVPAGGAVPAVTRHLPTAAPTASADSAPAPSQPAVATGATPSPSAVPSPSAGPTAQHTGTGGVRSTGAPAAGSGSGTNSTSSPTAAPTVTPPSLLPPLPLPGVP